jgi:hypothetical protein
MVLYIVVMMALSGFEILFASWVLEGDNLEWVTNKENQIHKVKTGLGNSFTRKIIQYDLEMNEFNKFNSIKEASDILKICTSGIKAVLYNKQKTSKNFIFKYLEE